MKTFRSLSIALLLTLSLGLAACGGSRATVDARGTTLGQELQDLDDAYQKGIITEKEYKSKKKAIMKKY